MKKIIMMVVVLTFFAGCSKLSQKPEFISYSTKKPKNILIFNDGTGNDRDTRTNIRRLFEIIANQDRPDIYAYYDKGVGASLLQKITGNALGVGFSRNVREAYAFISANYRPGDKIYLFGFSRGAFTSRALSGMIKFCGLMRFPSPPKNLTPEELEKLDEQNHQNVAALYNIYKRNRKSSFKNELETFKQKHETIDADIEMIGVWDTVEALGMPTLSNVPEDHEHKFYRFELHDNIKKAYHVLSIDDLRKYFWPMLWKKKNGELKKGQILEQVWFAGVHSDVGGGYEDSRELAGLSLNWMLRKLEQEGLIHPGYRVSEDPLGKIHDSWTQLYAVQGDMGKRVRDDIVAEHKIHKSVQIRLRNDKKYRPEQFNQCAPDFNLSQCLGVQVVE